MQRIPMKRKYGNDGIIVHTKHRMINTKPTHWRSEIDIDANYLTTNQSYDDNSQTMV